MLEDNALVTRIVSRFHIIVTVVIALAGAAIFGAAAGGGEFFNIYLAIFGAAFIALMLALGDKYWMVIPFAFTSQLPAVPIKGRLLELPEITAVLCSLVFLLRYAVKRQTLAIFRRLHAPILCYVGWVMLVFALNPVGLSSFGEGGGALGGARFYAKILMALAAFLIIANQNVTEKDCKWVILILVCGSLLSSAYHISIFFLPHGLGVDVPVSDPTDQYSWHQAIATVPILLITLSLAKYRTSQLFSFNRIWLIILLSACLLLVAISGKRTAVGSIVVVAVAATIFRKEWGFLVLWVAGAVIASTIIVVGHGTLFKFPYTVQRALSFLPAQWSSEFQIMEGGKDVFRAELRRLALKKIEKDPWIGTGYQVDLSLSQALTAQYATRGGDTELQVMPFALGSAWHNTWLGFAADFGIPLAVIEAWIYCAVILRGRRLYKTIPTATYAGTLAMYQLLLAIRILAFTQVGGHTALGPFEFWWSYGLQVALLLRPPNKARELIEPNRDSAALSGRPHYPSRPLPQFR